MAWHSTGTDSEVSANDVPDADDWITHDKLLQRKISLAGATKLFRT